jgi:hypothetical protein
MKMTAKSKCDMIENRAEEKQDTKEARIAQIMAAKEIPIGTRFIRRSKKRKDIETIVDVYKTYNMKGELVCIRYVTEHEFLGQIVTDSDVLATTVKLGEIL